MKKPFKAIFIDRDGKELLVEAIYRKTKESALTGARNKAQQLGIPSGATIRIFNRRQPAVEGDYAVGSEQH